MTAVNAPKDDPAAEGAPPSRRLVPALARGLTILEELAASAEPQTAADLCRRTGLPRTTVHDLIRTLSELGYVREVDERLHSFRLGGRVLTLGDGYLTGLDLAREADDVVRRLSTATSETTQVAVLEGAEVLYVAKAESTHMLRLVSAVGRRLPAHLTGVGKAMLAHLPPSELDALYQGRTSLPTMTPHSIASVEELRERLAEVRRQGHARDWCESNPDVACVAAPVFDRTGRVVAAMSISVPVSRFDETYCEHLLSELSAAAEELMRSLGRR